MRPLTPDDPRTVGEYRTLVRLGAGGMGVVYLARSPGGALAAVKVIRAEHATDPGFRARFRREAEAARRVTGPWVVPVTGADAEAREPWLATGFVPGPSLAEVVAAEGPLPVTTVRALGARLAGALVAVHGAGLVHRDVKPGNILLALDGPRLIDFGIARHEGATALTATDAVIGTPGYLAPEQASAGPLGPACDIFSLGCVLVYAATGRRPFGDDGAAAVLFRTVNEPPDLRGLPPELLPLVEACLAKDPADRPTARQVEERLGGTGPAPSWALPGLSALIAERSATALALPVPEPPMVVEDPEQPRPSRRRLLTASAAGAVLLAGGGTAVWLAGRGTGGKTEPHRALPVHTIGLHADLTGPGRAVGLAHRRGMQLAVDDHNARAGITFRLALRAEDDAGDPARALRVADRLAADPKVLAVVGPTGNVVAEDVVERYERTDLAQAVVSARSTTAKLGAVKTLCVLRPFDDKLSFGIHHYLIRVRPADRLAIVEDGADPEGAWAITDMFRGALPKATRMTVHQVAAGTDDFGTVARAVVAEGADAVVLASTSPTRGARCAVALAAAGFTGSRVSTGPVLAPAFLDGAGKAAEGWVFAQAYSDPTVLPAAKAFTAAHRKRFGGPPARWAAEAYDAVGLIARATSATSATGAEREGITQRLFLTTHKGITRTISFRSSRQLRFEEGIFLYRVEDGRARFLGPYLKV
ncbi:bifunctional serine/threonine-protein kinase/ABC transporter substrate-binding protein [Streptomyces sp. ML-6]|uniref:bifunctional serine/threonine-protein kinase/ABC transporter substrate-binding protein n=1 Tax=Streptomyces sp. ML-6 TaxID=2982693 RepID=UPI0024BF908F|nr:bifunctional serine/threonine-protein kinase/ABC transporter substrate-binding protein [Streptomyces sp. ML-6]MDK0522925.1 bifunctional serine/threonine-protein kinase/ABC transporter substrate-binding protein [Streptomyces sp. ML-6]